MSDVPMEVDDYEKNIPFSRCSSAGSLNAMTSSANNTDDEDSDLGTQYLRDRRREAHTQAEQKRRDAIKKGYDNLQSLIPKIQNSDQGSKMSKATVLQKSIDYIHYMQAGKKKQEDEVAALKKEVFAMTIMKLNYEQIVSAHQNQPGSMSQQVPEDIKFEVFRAVIESLFRTFDPTVMTGNFAEISGSVIQWVEEHCKPQNLREIMCAVLKQLQQHEYATSAATMETSLPQQQNQSHQSAVGPSSSLPAHQNLDMCSNNNGNNNFGLRGSSSGGFLR